MCKKFKMIVQLQKAITIGILDHVQFVFHCHLNLDLPRWGLVIIYGNMVVVKLAEYENHYTTSSQKKLKSNITI